MKNQVRDRLFLCALILLTVFASLAEPESLNYMIVRIGGAPGKACILALFALGIVALLDTLVNDVLPEGYNFRTGERFRQGIWLWIAITFAGICFVITKHGVGYWISAQYLLYAVACASVSFVDLHDKHIANSTRHDRRSTDRKSAHA